MIRYTLNRDIAFCPLKKGMKVMGPKKLDEYAEVYWTPEEPDIESPRTRHFIIDSTALTPGWWNAFNQEQT